MTRRKGREKGGAPGNRNKDVTFNLASAAHMTSPGQGVKKGGVKGLEASCGMEGELYIRAESESEGSQDQSLENDKRS